MPTDPTRKALEAAPEWCGYPEPMRPAAGCWSLLGGRIHKREDCADCDCALGRDIEADRVQRAAEREGR